MVWNTNVIYTSPLQRRYYMEIDETKKPSIRRRSHFFDVKQEYGDFKDNSDTNSSDDVPSETSFLPSEGGYISDQSEATLTRNESSSTRKKYTKQQLDERHHSSQVEINSETDDGLVMSEKVRKTSKCSKKHKKKKKRKITTEETSNRRSWTDSGVSLSRTDQSHCGTIGKDQLETTTSPQFESIPFKSEENFIQKTTEEIVTTEEVKEIQIPIIKIDKPNKETLLNRCSIFTDRSSLTNVTNISYNDLTALSSDSDIDDDLYHGHYTPTNNDTPKISPKIENRRVSGNIENSAEDDKQPSTITINYEKEKCHQNDDQSEKATTDHQNKSSNHEINIQINAILGNQFSNNNIDDLKVSKTHLNLSEDMEFIPRRKSNSFMSGIKKVTGHFRPRFFSFSSKNYKDVSSDFSFQKNTHSEKNTHSDKSKSYSKFERSKSFDVQPKQIHNANITSNISLQNSFSECTVNNTPSQQTSILSPKQSAKKIYENNELLDCLSNKPIKSRRLFDRIFRRSRSYSAEKVVQQKGKHTHRRDSSQSIPENFKASLFNRNTKSLENIRYGENYCNKNSVENLDFIESGDNTIFNPITRVQSLTQLQNFNQNIYTKARSNSTPTTPVLMHRNTKQPVLMHRNQTPNNFYNVCNCEECVYEEYLDYLAFQEFRRNKSLTHIVHQNYQEGEESIMHPPPYFSQNYQPCQDNQGNFILNPCVHDNIIAPLDVVKATERQAKTLRTSMYDTFV